MVIESKGIIRPDVDNADSYCDGCSIGILGIDTCIKKTLLKVTYGS